MRKRQRFKCHGFGFDLQTYQKLRDYGFGNQDILILSQNPAKFLKEFKKHSKNIPDGLKNDAYIACKKAIARKEVIWYGKHT